MKTMHTMRFFVTACHWWWTPVTRRRHHRLNDAAGDFGFSFSDRISKGIARIGRDNEYPLVPSVMSAPKGAFVHSASMVDKAVRRLERRTRALNGHSAWVAAWTTRSVLCQDVGSGRVFVFE